MIDIIKTSSINNSKKSSALLMCICKRDPTGKSIKNPIIKGKIKEKIKLNNNALTPYLNPNLSEIGRSRLRLTNNKAQRRAKAMI